jgi:hypothetical protein
VDVDAALEYAGAEFAATAGCGGVTAGKVAGSDGGAAEGISEDKSAARFAAYSSFVTKPASRTRSSASRACAWFTSATRRE